MRAVALIDPGGYHEVLLSPDEETVPEARLQAALYLRDVDVGVGVFLPQSAGVVVHEEAEIEERRRDRLSIDPDVFFEEVQAAGSDNQGRDLLVQSIGLPFLGLEGD